MTPEEYQETVQKIQAIHNEARETALAQIEAEEEKDLSALRRVWKLQHKEPPPALSSLRRPGGRRGQRVELSETPLSQKEKIRRIIRGGHEEVVETPVILQKFRELYPHDDQPDSSTVSKVFREMEGDGKLKCVRKAGFQEPAQYKKIEAKK